MYPPLAAYLDSHHSQGPGGPCPTPANVVRTCTSILSCAISLGTPTPPPLRSKQRVETGHGLRTLEHGRVQ